MYNEHDYSNLTRMPQITPSLLLLMAAYATKLLSLLPWHLTHITLESRLIVDAV